jgi:hypothetical protein
VIATVRTSAAPKMITRFRLDRNPRLTEAAA